MQVRKQKFLKAQGFYGLDVTKDTIANSKKQSKLFAERKALESAYVSIMSTSKSVNGVTDVDEIIVAY